MMTGGSPILGNLQLVVLDLRILGLRRSVEHARGKYLLNMFEPYLHGHKPKVFNFEAPLSSQPQTMTQGALYAYTMNT